MISALIIIILGIYSILHKTPAEPVYTVQKEEYRLSCDFSESELLEKINSVRTYKLSIDPYLDFIAQDRADKLSRSLDNHAGMRTLRSSGVFNNYRGTGENLASSGCPSADRLFIQWKNSPGHWINITDEHYNVIGIGFNKSQGTAVTIFGDTY